MQYYASASSTRNHAASSSSSAASSSTSSSSSNPIPAPPSYSSHDFKIGNNVYLVLNKERPKVAERIVIRIWVHSGPKGRDDAMKGKNGSTTSSTTDSGNGGIASHHHQQQLPPHHQNLSSTPQSLLQKLLLQQMEASVYPWVLRQGLIYQVPIRLLNATVSMHVVDIIMPNGESKKWGSYRAPCGGSSGSSDSSTATTNSQQKHSSSSSASSTGIHFLDSLEQWKEYMCHRSANNKTASLYSSNTGNTPNSPLPSFQLNHQMDDWITRATASVPGYESIIKDIITTIHNSARSFCIMRHQREKRTNPSRTAAAYAGSGKSFEAQHLKQLTEKQQQYKSTSSSGTTYLNVPLLLPYSMTRGILLSGPSGIGKTLLAQSIAKTAPSSQWRTVYLNATYIFGGDVGQSEKNVNMEFQKAIDASENGKYCVLFVIDQMEAMSMNRSMMDSSRIEKLVILQFVHCLEKLRRMQQSLYLVVLGLTADASLVDHSLRESGRFDREFEMTVPSQVARSRIIRYLLSKGKHSCDEKCLEDVALSTHGMVAADLCKVVSEARLHASRELRASKSASQPTTQLASITDSDLQYSVRNTQPSLLLGREFKFKPVSLSEMAGIEPILKQIQISIIDPMVHRNRYSALGVSPPKGVLLSGPSGVGKSTLAAAVATAVKANFVSVQCPDIISKIVGSSSRAISSLFKQARACAPCVLFFDQFEAIARSRSVNSSSGHYADQMLSTLLIEMDGVYGVEDAERPVLILAASNRVDLLDPAVLRPGRMDQQIYIDLPNQKAREAILCKKTEKMPLDRDSVNLERIAQETEGYSGAQLENICREAAMLALRENIDAQTISQEHFEAALQMSSAGL